MRDSGEKELRRRQPYAMAAEREAGNECWKPNVGRVWTEIVQGNMGRRVLFGGARNAGLDVNKQARARQERPDRPSDNEILSGVAFHLGRDPGIRPRRVDDRFSCGRGLAKALGKAAVEWLVRGRIPGSRPR